MTWIQFVTIILCANAVIPKDIWQKPGCHKVGKTLTFNETPNKPFRSTLILYFIQATPEKLKFLIAFNSLLIQMLVADFASLMQSLLHRWHLEPYDRQSQ